MTRNWKLEEAKTHLSQLIRDAEKEPQVITRHGRAVALVSPVAPESGVPPARAAEKPSPQVASTALEALLGGFDFSDFPDDELFARDRSSGPRDADL